MRKRITPIQINELRIRQPLACELRHCREEPHFVGQLARVESKRLLIQIPEQMKRFNVNVSALKAALEQRPEIFQPVRVDVTFGVALGVINDLVFKITVQAEVSRPFIGENIGTFFNMPVHIVLQGGLPPALSRALRRRASISRLVVPASLERVCRATVPPLRVCGACLRADCGLSLR